MDKITCEPIDGDFEDKIEKLWIAIEKEAYSKVKEVNEAKGILKHDAKMKIMFQYLMSEINGIKNQLKRK